jgi:hypothetical protein
VLQRIDVAAQKEFSYGTGGIDTEEIVEELLNDAH